MQVNDITACPDRQVGVSNERSLLKFGSMKENKKLSLAMRREGHARGYYGRYLTFSLPAGYSCPFAHDCQSRADRVTGRITDGKHTQFRCYAATQEARGTNLRNSRHRNFDLLRKLGSGDMYELIRESLIEHDGWDNRSVIRVHVSGDFFNPAYFNAWQKVAFETPFNLYYAYTKSVPYVVSALTDCKKVGVDEPAVNFKVVVSRGGTHDHLIEEHGLRSAEVVFSEHEAEEKGLVIDHDDTTAAFTDESFALLIHGQQPKGSDAAKALSALRLVAA